MNTAFYIFVLSAFMILKAMLIPGATAQIFLSPSINTFDFAPDIDEIIAPIETSDCEVLVLCLNVVFEFIAEFLVRVFEFLTLVVQIILNIIAFIVELLVFIGLLVFTTIDGAPIYVNVLLITIPAIMLGLAVINAFKPGAEAT